jgi:outer membrane protein assembly factor BamA
MTAGALPMVVVALLLAGGQPHETVTAIEVHGNTATSDAEIRTLSGLEIGAPFGPTTIQDTTARLEMTKRFQRVEVLKRYASIADPSQVLVVVIVDEGAVRIEMTNDPSHPTRVVHDRNLKLLFMPVVSHEDGYGTAYGVRMTRRDPAGAQSRLSIPLTWGGDKRAALEFDKIFDTVAVGRVLAGASMSRRTIPFFDQDDDRARLWVRGERDVLPHLRIGATAAVQHDAFVDEHDSLVQTGADVTLDTRIDPVLPRNAVFARVAWDRFAVRPQGRPGDNDYSVNRIDLDARGYVGVFRQNVLAVRAYKTDSDAPLPAYLKPLLGGLANLRGFAAGTAVGDTLVATSAELIVPLTSPLSIGKFGVNTFVDAAAIYDKGSFLADQTWKQGYGGGVWFSAAFLRRNVVVAHGRGSTTRVHFGANLSF